MSTSHKSFWSSVPGLVTGLAGILTGVVGVVGLLFQLGVIGGSNNSPVGSTPTTGGSGTSVATNTPEAKGKTAGNVSFTVDRSDVPLTAVANKAVVTVTNQGSTPLVVKKPRLTGADPDKFSVAAGECTSSRVASGDSCQITVTYAGGLAATATMTVSADDTSATEEVTLRGTLVG